MFAPRSQSVNPISYFLFHGRFVQTIPFKLFLSKFSEIFFDPAKKCRFGAQLETLKTPIN